MLSAKVAGGLGSCDSDQSYLSGVGNGTSDFGFRFILIGFIRDPDGHNPNTLPNRGTS